MKEYRSSLADVKALAEVMEFAANRIENYADLAEIYRKRMEEEDDGSKDYYECQIAENVAMSAACERLLSKLSK